MLGAALALLSAATFGLNTATLRRGVLGGTVVQAIAVTNAIGVPLLAIACLVFGAFGVLAGLSREAWLWFASAGVVHFVFGRYANYRATRALGATQSGPIQQVSLLISLALALVILDEVLTPLRAFGIVLILLGPVIIFRRRMRHATVTTRSGITLDYFEGYVWGLLCAAAFGTSPLLIRFGLEDGGLLQGVAGGLASYLASATVVSLLMLLNPAFRRDVLAIDRTTVRWFSATGFFVCMSQMLVFMALSIAPVTVVQPIQRTALMFRVAFSWVINRDHEVFSVSILVAIAVSMLGVLAVTVDEEILIAAVGLPVSLADFMRLAWP